MVAQELITAAGLRGKQNWALILSSSARVSEVTCETVVAVRYPELDAATPARVIFGNYLADQQARTGGYLPVFSLAQSRDDLNFLEAFRLSATFKTGEFPPAALVELYYEPEASTARLRRLHLVIVDLLHPRKTATWTEKHFYQQITRLWNERGDNVTPIPLCNQEEWRCRYVFGYSLDDSDKAVYLIWPERTRTNGFWLLDTDRNQYHNLCQTASICNQGLEHFYAAFG